MKYKKKHLLEYIKCKKDPVYFIKNYYTVQHPIKGMVKLKLQPYQESLIRSYEDNQFTVVLPARQVGTTAVSTAYILWFNMFHDDKTTLMTGYSNFVAEELLYRIRYAYAELPKWFRSLSEVTSINKHEMQFENGSRIIASDVLTCIETPITPSLLYIDTLAFVEPSLQSEFSSFIRPMLILDHGKCIIASTPNKNNDLFSELWHEAQEGNSGFHPVHIHWDAPKDRDENFKQDMINCIGEKRWRQEYECEFIVE